MNRVFCSLIALGLLLGVEGRAKAGYAFTTLDVPGAANFTQAFGINNPGQIVGLYQFPSGSDHGYLLSGGVYTKLGVT